MFSVGDTVVYGTQGVCRIEEKKVMRMGKTEGEYLVLQPIADAKSTVFVPVSSEKLMAKMREVLSKEELDALILRCVNDPKEWIESDDERKEYCESTIKSGDRGELIRLIGMLYEHRESLKNQKRHFHTVDAQYLKSAEHLLHDEFAYVLGIAAAAVPEYIYSLQLRVKNLELRIKN